jgi:hypothetical protein
MFDDLDTMHRLSDRPILIGEFSYRAADAGLPNTLPPFFPTLATQAERAQATGTYLRRVLARPYVVGAHWFQYMDQPATGRFDGENQNFGLVTITDDLWPALTARIRSITADAAPRRLLAPGGPDDGADCTLEWAATAPLAASSRGRAVPRPRFVCRDGDPACDTDAVPGQCTIEVQPCAAIADERVPGCVAAAPAAIEVTRPRAERDPDLQAAIAASLDAIRASGAAAPGSCGPAVAVVLPLETKRRAHRLLRIVATVDDDADHDTVRLVCTR